MEAPIAFLIPTSFVRCAALKEASPSKPKAAIKMASTEKMLKTEAVALGGSVFIFCC